MGSTGAMRVGSAMGNVPASASFDVSTATLRELKMHIAENFARADVRVTDKWGDYLQTDTGFTDGKGNLYSVERTGTAASGASVFKVLIGDTSRGFVAANYGLSEQEAWERMYSYLTK